MARLHLSTALALALALAAAASGCSDDEGCPSGQTECNGVCRDAAFFQSDPDNCGACGIACGFGSCAAGACQCDPAALACPQGSPRCVDAQNDALNCGACGLACEAEKPGAGCAAGVCACVAPADDDCGAFCTDTLTDARNCGADAAAGCGQACPLASQICAGGACACPPSRPDLCPVAAPTRCVSLASDEQDCGACGTRCAAGATCTAGACACPAGETVCAGACVNTGTDELNCGGCGNVCPGGSACASGQCGAVACTSPTPQRCGSSCCAGTGCCGDGCQVQHSNGAGVPGLGQSFFDCVPLGTHDAIQAEKAARAWQPGDFSVPLGGLLCQACVGWQTTSACGVWCYGTGPTDPLRGRAALNTINQVCVCPTAGPPNWN